MAWRAAPRQGLNAAREGKLSLFTSAILLAELEDVLERDKFVERLTQTNVTAHQLVLGFAALAALVEPAVISPVVEHDIDDDAVLACAVAAQAEQIGSGDGHLLRLKTYREIPILTAAEILFRLESNLSNSPYACHFEQSEKSRFSQERISGERSSQAITARNDIYCVT